MKQIVDKDLLLNSAEKRGYKVSQTDTLWPFNYSGNEAYHLTNSKNETVYLCFCSNTGKLISKILIKKD